MRHTSSLNRQRRGTVTVIVVAFLALFAVLGLTFLIASQRFATTSRLAREAMTRERDTPPQPDVLMQKVMGDILYDAPDDATGVYKATRGWSFGRLMYGQNPNTTNTVPYSGIGRKRDNAIPAALVGPTKLEPAVVTDPVLGVPVDYKMLNYQYFPYNMTNGVKNGTSDGFVRDPEFAGPSGGFRSVADITKPIDLANAPRGAGDFYWPINANYTAADENNPYLAVIDPTTGKVLVPSFHRQAIFGSLDKNANPNWTNAVGKYMTFRPRPNEHSASFPYPKQNTDGTFGDVENLEGKLGGTQYDSLWMDMDLPVSYWRGKRYKPLVAMLITDLDSRINLNTAGNLRNGVQATGLSHGSNQNWGPWEVNLDNILQANGDTNRLLRGNMSVANQATSGRYGGPNATMGPPVVPPNPNYAAVGPFRKPFTMFANDILDSNPVGGYLPHFYAPIDMDGGAAVPIPPAPPAPRWRFPNAGTALTGSPANAYEAFPVFGSQTPFSPTVPFAQLTPYAPDNRYWNGRSDNETIPVYSERLNHPMLFNPYLNPFVSLPSSQAFNSFNPKTFAASEMIGLNGKYIPPSNTVHPTFGGPTLNSYTGLLRSDSARLTSLGINVNAANRFRVTTISNDVDLPGGTPWLGAGGATPFTPPSFSPNYPYLAGIQPNKFDATLGGGDFDPIRKQSLAGVLGSVDLNRPLTDYRLNANAPYAENNLAPVAQLTQAMTDRQNLAADIFLRLRAATGTPEPDASLLPTGATQNQFLAAQSLAQLAVNIVDYIDHDDYSTPFNWNPAIAGTPIADASGNLNSNNAKQSWVFGHELPRLVINEAMARLENDPSEPDLMADPKPKDRVAQKPYKMRIWTELHNPLTPRDANEIGQLADQGQARLVSTGMSGPQYPIYRMRIVKSSTTAINALTDPSNVGGEPPAAEVRGLPAVLNTSVGGPPQAVFPNLVPTVPTQVIGYKDTNNATQPSFFIAGPKGDAAGGLPQLPDSTKLSATGQFDNLEYDVMSPGGGSPGLEPAAVIADTTWSPVIVLQRLLNEHQLPGPTNPYITVDVYMPANYTQQLPANLNNGNINPVSIVQDRLQITPTVDRVKGMTIPAWNTIASFGKREPYVSYMHIPTPSTDTSYKQQPSEAAMSSQIQHTFTRHNGKDVTGAPSMGNDTLNRPFSTLIHLDRSVSSAAELLSVSQFGSHMVAQLNYIAPIANYTVPPPVLQPLYRASWLDKRTNLYRAFDLLTTHKRFYGQGNNGRTPGLVNLNALNPINPYDPSNPANPFNPSDREVFYSIMDYQHLSDSVAMTLGTSGKHFTRQDVDLLWTTLLFARNIDHTNPIQSLQNGSARPLLGTMSPIVDGGVDPQYPTGMGMDRTVAGVVAKAPIANPHPSGLPVDRIKQELLETLLPNVTTRSNTFAVYATFGFFEVLNAGTGTDGLTYDDTNRPQLGSEVIGVDGKPVRYKFYSVIDRTQLSADTSTNNLQGIGNVHLSYEPVAYNTPPTLPTLAANPVVVGAPDPQPPSGSSIYVTVAIPRTSFTAGVAVGNYDGVAWKIKANDQLILDGFPDAGIGPGVINNNMMIPTNKPPFNFRNSVEIVNVAQVQDDPTNGRALVTFTISKPHYRGANLRLMGPDLINFPFQSQPGNPRSQSGTFNLGANTYKSVIPVFERIDGY